DGAGHDLRHHLARRRGLEDRRFPDREDRRGLRQGQVRRALQAPHRAAVRPAAAGPLARTLSFSIRTGDDAMADSTLKGLLDKLGNSAAPSPKEKTQAENAEEAWIAKFEDRKRKVIRPTFEALGQEVRKREHDFNIIEFPFKRLDTRP